jgi:hypothetical protein
VAEYLRRRAIRFLFQRVAGRADDEPRLEADGFFPLTVLALAVHLRGAAPAGARALDQPVRPVHRNR